jgi:hypothetical protein
LKSYLPIGGPLDVSIHLVLWSEEPKGVANFDDGKLDKLLQEEIFEPEPEPENGKGK